MSNKAKIIAGACGIFGVAAIVAFFLLSGSKTYNVSFDTDGGSSIPTQTVKKGEKANKPSNPTKEEYSFLRWEYQDKEYDFNSTVESDITLKAIWEKVVPQPKYKITFNVDGKEQTIEVGEASEIDVSNLGFEEKNGYVLKWYVDGKEYDISTPLTEDMSIEGKYEKVTTYTVKFNSNGGTKVNNQTVVKGGKVTEPSDVKKEGYVLDGWYLDNKKYDFDTEISKNITLVAKWSEDPNVIRYEVTFNSDGGSKVSSQRVIENTKVTKPKDPTKSGYAFDEWYLDNKKYDFNSKVTSNITLVAKWRELQKYTVTFDSSGGSSVTSQTVVEGNKATKPSNPTRDGYTFKRWMINGTEYNFNNVVNSNITLTAEWDKNVVKYTVTFNSNGGTNVTSQSVEAGKTATKPKDPTKAGYTFKRWMINGTEYNFNDAVNSNITLTAEWEEVVKYTVVVNMVDNISPARTLTVYRNGSAIAVNSIKTSDGVVLCKNGCKSSVDKSDIGNERTFKVILTDNKEVTATLE